MTAPSAKIIADSISPWGDRLTTIEATFHRFVLAEANTHRSHSRNSASSRAIPFTKQAARVESDIAYPVVWATERGGMQGGEPLSEADTFFARQRWELAAKDALRHAQVLADLGLHKSLVNRLLEPFAWHTIIASATDAGWSNFFVQRCSPLAQPEMRVAAEAMQETYYDSNPTYVEVGEWHLPYINHSTDAGLGLESAKRVAVARCARVSYLSHDGKRDVDADLALYDKLVTADPPHASPLEHVATPCATPSLGNFYGWRQLRHEVTA